MANRIFISSSGTLRPVPCPPPPPPPPCSLVCFSNCHLRWPPCETTSTKEPLSSLSCNFKHRGGGYHRYFSRSLFAEAVSAFPFPIRGLNFNNVPTPHTTVHCDHTYTQRQHPLWPHCGFHYVDSPCPPHPSAFSSRY